ncbi:hypothetical protein [Streptomyces sp. LaPpAH-108]|uniref:hypothetical protein n=1 Tax=Streptomyces sp. LaPpAH-108 TaxID=1155714 RepID=UPI000375DB4C|nr:hypothetical protein [Streptomyces sp. LaPpAH-108]
MQTLRSFLNRTVLALTGLTLLVGGSGLALSGTPAAGRLPVPPAHHAFLTSARLVGLRAQGWWAPGVMAGSFAATALCALWCARQFSVGGGSLLPLPGTTGALRTRALEDALNHDAAALHGVARCRTRVFVSRGRLTVRLHLWLQPGTTPAAVLPGLTRLIGRAETATAPCTVHSRVRLSHRSHRVPHVR